MRLDFPFCCTIMINGCKEGELSVHDWVNWIDTVPSGLNVLRINLEYLPIIDIEPILRKATTKGLEVEVLVKNWQLSGEKDFTLLQSLEKIAALLLHVDMATPDLPNYNDLLKWMKIAIQMTMPLDIFVPVSKDISPFIDKILEMSEVNGAKKTIFSRKCFTGEPRGIWEEQFFNCLGKGVESGYRVSVEGCVPRCAHRIFGKQGCTGGIFSVFISANGEIFPCNVTDKSCGNIVNKSLLYLWNSPEMLSYVARNVNPCCTGCPIYPSCGSTFAEDLLIKGPESLPVLSELQWNSIEQESRPLLMCNKVIKDKVTILHESIEFRHFYLCKRTDDLLLDQLDGKHTLRELEAQFGDSGRSLIQRLFLERFLSFLS